MSVESNQAITLVLVLPRLILADWFGFSSATLS